MKKNLISVLLKSVMGTGVILILGKVLILFSGLLLARGLGPNEYGMYNYILSLCTVIAIPLVSGLNPLIVRETSKSLIDSKISQIKGLLVWVFQYCSFMYLFILIVSLCLYLLDIENKNYIFLILIIVLLKAVLNIQSSFLQALKQPIISNIPLNIIIPLGTVTCLLTYKYLGFNIKVTTALTVFSLSAIIGVLFSIYCLIKFLPPRLLTENIETKNKLWRHSMVSLGLIGVITTLNSELATILLGYIGTLTDVAFFKVSLSGVVLLSVGMQAVNTVIAPDIAKKFQSNDIKELQTSITNATFLSSVVSLPIFLVIIIFSQELISLAFGADYIEASLSLVIVAIGQFINILFGSVGLILNMAGHEKKTLKSFIFGLILTSILLLLLVPLYKYVGAAISISIGMVVWPGIMSFYIYKLTGLKSWIRIRETA